MEKNRSARTIWVRRIVGVKKMDSRRMDELREEIGVQISLTEILVRSGLFMWCGWGKREWQREWIG